MQRRLGRVNRKNKKVSECERTKGSTRLPFAVLSISFFAFAFASAMNLLSESYDKVDIQSEYYYDMGYYVLPFVIVSLLFMMCIALIYCIDEFYTFINDDRKNERNAKADKTYSLFVRSFKLHLLINFIALMIVFILYNSISKFIQYTLIATLLIVFISMITGIIKGKKYKSFRIKDYDWMQVMIYVLFGLVYLSFIGSFYIVGYKMMKDEHFSSYEIRFIDGKDPEINIISEFNIQENLYIEIKDSLGKQSQLDFDDEVLVTSSLVKVNDIRENESEGLFSVRTNDYYDLNDSYDKYHISIVLDDEIEIGTNNILIEISNGNKELKLINIIQWDGEKGEFLEKSFKND